MNTEVNGIIAQYPHTQISATIQNVSGNARVEEIKDWELFRFDIAGGGPDDIIRTSSIVHKRLAMTQSSPTAKAAGTPNESLIAGEIQSFIIVPRVIDVIDEY